MHGTGHRHSGSGPGGGLGRGFLVASMCALLLACADPASDEAGDPGQDAADAAPGPACPALRQRPDEGCCPPGTMYAYDLDACSAIGPPGCAFDLQTNPQGCTPRWCGDWADGSGQVCEPGNTGCWLRGRACSEAELAAGAGCPVGTWPKPGAADACVQVGTGPLLAGPFKGEEAEESGLPAIAPLPAVVTPTWCWDLRDGAGEVCTVGQPGCVEVPRRCQAGGADPGCPAGQWSPSGVPGVCVAAGVGWVCPPGFRADVSAASGGGLPPCLPDNAVCPPGKWGGLEGPGVRYVDAAAKAEGDGSAAAPFRSLGTAVAQSPAGSTLALAAGVYQAGLTLTKPLSIVGRCAAMVTLIPKPGAITLSVAGPEAAAPAVFEGLRLTGDSAALMVQGALRVQARRLFFDRPWGRGVHLEGPSARLTLEDSVIHAVGTAPDSASAGMGLVAVQGAAADLLRVRVSDCQFRGVTAEGQGSAVQARELVVTGTRKAPASAKSGDAVVATSGAVLRLRGVRLAGNARGGVMISGGVTALSGLALNGSLGATAGKDGVAVYGSAAAQWTLAGARVGPVLGGAVGASGLGTSARVGGLATDEVWTGTFGVGAAQSINGARLELLGSRLEHTHGAGVLAAGKGTEALLDDVVVAGSDDAQKNVAALAGVYVADAARVWLRASRLTSNTMFGLLIDGGGAQVEAVGLLVDRTHSSAYTDANLLRPAGVRVRQGHLRLQDARVSEARYSGLQVFPGGVVEAAGLLLDHGQYVQIEVSFQDGAVLGTEIRSHGVLVRGAGRVTLAGARSSRMMAQSILAADKGSLVDAVGLLVDRTLTEYVGRKWGVGAMVDSEAHIRCVACALVANRSGSAMARSGGWLELTDSVVRATQAESFDVQGHDPVELADAVVSRDAGIVDVQRCLLSDNPRAGVLVVLGGQATVRNNAVTSNGYGLVAQGAGKLTVDANAFWDNTIANQATDEGLAIPPAPGVSGGPQP